MSCFLVQPRIGDCVRTFIRTGRRRDQFAQVTGTLKAIVGDMAFVLGDDWPPFHDGSIPVPTTWVWVPLNSVRVVEGDEHASASTAQLLP